MSNPLKITTPIIIGNDFVAQLGGVAPDGTRHHVVDAAGVPIDMTGWTMRYFLRKEAKSSSALLQKDAELIGDYDPDPAINTQGWRAVFTDTETEVLKDNLEAAFAWKRMDDGSERDVAYGTQPILRTASR